MTDKDLPAPVRPLDDLILGLARVSEKIQAACDFAQHQLDTGKDSEKKAAWRLMGSAELALAELTEIVSGGE